MTERQIVPCDGCTVCCRDEHVFLHPERGDDPSRYHTRELFNPLTGLMGIALAADERGACVYLGDRGCTIHDAAPAICRAFDCKGLYERLAEVFGMREVNTAVARSRVLQVGMRRSKGERP